MREKSSVLHERSQSSPRRVTATHHTKNAQRNLHTRTDELGPRHSEIKCEKFTTQRKIVFSVVTVNTVIE